MYSYRISGRLIKGLIQNESQFIQSLRVFSNTSTLSGLGATGGINNNAPQLASGNYFNKSGDFMVGQYGDCSSIVEIIDGAINVAKSGGVTSPMILLNPESGLDDELDNIIPGVDVFFYQRLRIRTHNKDITFTENGNIKTPQGGNFIVPPDNIVELVYDTVPQVWRIISATNGIIGADNLGDHIATEALKMNDNAIFLDNLQEQIIKALDGSNKYIVPVNGAHDFFVNDTVTPKFTITENSIESNVDLVMNDHTIFLDTAQTHSIRVNSEGTEYETAALKDHTFTSPNGIFMVLDEVNATDRRIDAQQNKIVNTGKYMFSPTFDLDTLLTSEIYETLTDNNLRYKSKNNHVFVVEGVTPPLLTIGNFAGIGGNLQDIAVINLVDSTTDPNFNGEFQMNGIDVKVFSGGVIRNLSDISGGDNLGDHIATQTLNMNDNLIENVDEISFFLNETDLFAHIKSEFRDFQFYTGNFSNISFFEGTTLKLQYDGNANTWNFFEPIVMMDNEIFLDTAQERLIKSDGTGISYETSELTDHTFRSPHGDFLALTEVNATDRRLDIKQNKITNIGKLSFTGTFDLHVAGFSEIFQTLTDEDLLYISKNTHIFEVDGQTQPLLSIGNFAGIGGNLQDIAVINLVDSTTDPNFNGEFQMNGIDVKVFSGGAIRNLSDIGAGGDSDKIVDADSNLTVIDGLGFNWTLDGIIIANMTSTEFLLGINLDMDNNDIENVDNLTVSGNATFNGAFITLGNSQSDSITGAGLVTRDWLPDFSGVRFIGDSSHRWGVGYFNRIAIDDGLATILADLGGLILRSEAIGDSIEFDTSGANTRMRIKDDEIQMFQELNMDDNDIDKVATLHFGSITEIRGSIGFGNLGILEIISEQASVKIITEDDNSNLRDTVEFFHDTDNPHLKFDEGGGIIDNLEIVNGIVQFLDGIVLGFGSRITYTDAIFTVGVSGAASNTPNSPQLYAPVLLGGIEYQIPLYLKA